MKKIETLLATNVHFTKVPGPWRDAKPAKTQKELETQEDVDDDQDGTHKHPPRLIPLGRISFRESFKRSQITTTN